MPTFTLADNTGFYISLFSERKYKNMRKPGVNRDGRHKLVPKGKCVVSKVLAELHVALFTATTIGRLQSVKGAHQTRQSTIPKRIIIQLLSFTEGAI